eukprot:CCRYP_009527-RA/>CCRYP_009527-RA protein AED:0.00 eAED:0.00 QI:14/1/1/1/0/0/2/68/41
MPHNKEVTIGGHHTVRLCTRVLCVFGFRNKKLQCKGFGITS